MWGPDFFLLRPCRSSSIVGPVIGWVPSGFAGQRNHLITNAFCARIWLKVGVFPHRMFLV
jgi:hypothetical protein